LGRAAEILTRALASKVMDYHNDMGDGADAMVLAKEVPRVVPGWLTD
jgi:hypothetical protein